MKKYLEVFKVSWSNGFVYRLNFVMWRVRMVLQILAIYFLWAAVTQFKPTVFGYTQAQLLTYIVGGSIIRSLVLSSRTTDIQGDIGTGDLNNHLLRPFNYFGFWFSRDAADKLLNVLFSFGEVIILYFLLKPPLVGPASEPALLFALVAAFLGMFLYFFFSLIISFSTFWMPEGNGWPQRFLTFTLLEFFAGGLFPLDAFPKPIYAIIGNLPTAYFFSTPLMMYLGRYSLPEMWFRLAMTCGWVVGLFLLARALFKSGTKIYGAYGR